MKSRLACIVVLLAVLGCTELHAGTVIYVNKNAPANSAINGTSWANAYVEFRQALIDHRILLATAESPVEIWVASGTYTPTDGTNRAYAFSLSSHLRILGGFKGTETSSEQRPFFGYPTVLSGDIGTPQANPVTHLNAEQAGLIPMNIDDPGMQDNSHNILFGNVVTDVVLDKLVIANGYAVSNEVSDDYIKSMSQALADQSDASLQGQTVAPLSRIVSGGALFLLHEHDRSTNGFNIFLNQCTFMNNSAIGYGGAVAVKEANVEVVFCTFKNNKAGEDGGAAYLQNCSFNFFECDFEANECSGAGGALQCETISSRKTLPQISDPVTFEQTIGIPPKKFQQYSGWAITAARVLPRFYINYQAMYTPKAGAFKNFSRAFKQTLPTNPATRTRVSYTSRAAGAYGWLCFAVAGVDFGVQIATMAGVSTNDTFIKGWKLFSDNFNRYATPQGYATMIVEAIVDKVGNPETFTQQATRIRKWQLNVYNQAPASSVLLCDFANNFAASQGGAVNVVHDNIQFEGCRFSKNIGIDNGGALALNAWTTPRIFSCTFDQNISSNGHSAVFHFEHARSQIINSTFHQNRSYDTNGFAIGNEKGSEVKIFNSILWGNLNATNTTGGADIYTATKALLATDPVAISNYNAAGPAFGDWIAICDIANSCVQSLAQLPVGTDDIQLFEAGHYSSAQIDERLQTYALAEEYGMLETIPFINLGEGNRPKMLEASRGNTAADPLLNSAHAPSSFSPAIDTGSSKRLQNGYNKTLTGVDVVKQNRFAGGSIDMGAVEHPGGFAQGDIVYVRPTATGNGSGSSWANATANLQGAMNQPGRHQVWVAAGTYYPTAGAEQFVSFSIGHLVAVYGGFAGTETNLSQRNWTNNPSILSGNIGNPNSDADNSYHVLYNTNIDSRALLDGFTITKGRANNWGGGIRNVNAYPTIQNCTFIDNSAQFDGGAIYSDGVEGSPIRFCQFSHNVATTGDGGAIGYAGSRLQVEQSSFENNRSPRSGGAIFVTGSDVAYIYNSLFVSNSVSGNATAAGGAIKGHESDLRIFNCTFYGNSLVSAGNTNGGGAVNFSTFTRSYVPSVVNSIFWRNTATNTGGAQPSLERQQLSLTHPRTPSFHSSIIEGLDSFTGLTTSSNLDIDPQFINAAAGNFRLTNFSPAIDLGRDRRSFNFPTVDLDAKLRFKGAGMDIGAYEFQGTPIQLATQIGLAKICDELGGIYTAQLNGANAPSTAYQWEVNKNDGAGFVSLANNNIYSGVTSAALNILHPPVSYTGYRYRVRGAAQGVSFTSSSVTLRVSRAVLYVKANAAGANNGTTWANAFTDLQSALAAAAPCSQIWVAAGTYYPSTTDTNVAFQMKPEVGIYGGFTGTETNLSQRNWRVNVTTLSGNTPAGRSRNIFYNNGFSSGFPSASAILDGFTLTGAANSAIANVRAAPTIRQCTFADNYSEIGGAIYNSDGSSATISACVFTRNVAGLGGGAIYNDDSEPYLVNCVFYDNQSNHRGGAIGNARARAHLQNCTLFNNRALSYGGGIWTSGGTLHVYNSILWGNTAGHAFGTVAGAQNFAEAGTTEYILNTCWQDSTGGSNPKYDPLFVNSDAGNFQLSPVSPLINAGNNSLIPGITTDAGGNPRIFGGTVDIGAFELQSTPSNSLYLLSAPQSVTICDTSTPHEFSVTGIIPGTNYQWELNSGSGFAPVPSNPSYVVTVSSNTSTLTVFNISGLMNGDQFRVVEIGSGLATPPATLTVAAPTILYVRAGQLGGLHDGTSWANAFTNLQEALNVAGTCTEIWVARGAYRPPTNSGVSAYRMKSGVAIYGGFFGNETARNQRNYATNISILAANTNRTSVIDNNGYFGSAIDTTAILDGFTFSNVTRTAAIKNSFSSPTIRHCRFINNTSFGILNDNASPTISACTFSNNLSSGIYNRNGNVTIAGCIFAQNQTSRPGAGVYNENAVTKLSDCAFTGNSSGWGSVFNDSGGHLTLSRCVFRDNSSSQGGGALFNGNLGSATLRNCLLEGNSAPAFHGGAIAHYGDSLTLAHCTLANNYASISGGGLYNQGANVQIRNSILWGNYLTGTWPDGTAEEVQIDDFQATVQVLSSTVQGLAGFAGNGNLGYDPLFTNSVAGDFRLNHFSPALNAGTNDLADTIDLAGNPRQFGAGVDMGAYELPGAALGALHFLSLPAAQSTCAGNGVSFLAVSAPAQNYTFQWQQFDGTNFVNVSSDANLSISNGTNSSTLQLTNLSLGLNGALFRLAVSNTAFVSPAFALGVYPPQVIYVRTNLANGNGTSWAKAFNNLKDAIAAADECSEIWIARGTYASSTPASLKNGLRIYGGFVGTEIQRDQRNWTNHPTILRALTTEAVLYTVGNSAPVDRSTLVDGITISGLSVRAVVNLVASPTFQNCTFADNAGTAVFNTERANPTFIQCVFSNNLAGAMESIPRCSPVVRQSTFVNNRSSFRGGAILNGYGSLELTDCRFLGNVCTIEAGGALCQEGSGSVTVSRCVFATNSAPDGGAILFLDSTGSIANCLFTDNSCNFRGGAVAQHGSSVTLHNSTFARNSAGAQGGGYYLVDGTLSATNSIFWFNTDQDIFGGTVETAQMLKFSGTANLAHCSVQGLNQFGGNNNSPYDPLFANPAAGDFSLNLLSPAINAGNNSAANSSPTDLAGNARVFGSVVDLGPFEVQSPTNSEPLRLLAEPLSSSICAGNVAALSVVGASNSTLTLTWQVRSNGTFQTISGDANHQVLNAGQVSTLIVSNTTTAMNGYQYRFISGVYTSAPVTLTVTPRAVVYVNVSNANPSQTGLSWANAFTNLQQALAIADACAEIWVAQGTYQVTAYLGANSFRLKQGLQIYGGFAGTETLRSQRNWTTQPAVLLGNGLDAVIVNDGYQAPLDSTTVLDGFTITSTNANNGILNYFASPIIRHCRFENNRGVALANSAGSPLIESCIFTANRFASVDLRNGSTATLTNCLFFGNASSNASVEIFDAAPAILNCRFYNNTNAIGTAGISARNGAMVSVRNSIFTNNVGGEAAAASVLDSSGSFVNCLLANNHATHAVGGVSSYRADVQFINCTIAQNSGTDRAGGLALGSGTNTLLNTIVWNNVDGDFTPTATSQQIYLADGAAVLRMTNSCLQGLAAASNGNFAFNPLFVDGAAGNFRLTTNSPAINAGGNGFALGALDLDGATRIQLSAVDMGAYEAAVAQTPLYISGSPGSQVRCPGEVATFTFAATNSASLRWLWNSGSGWVNFSVSGDQLSGPPLGSYFQSNSGSSISLIVSNTVVGMNGYRFYLTSTNGAFLGSPVTLSVSDAAIIFVNASAPFGGDGTSWATAYNSLQTALSRANSCRPNIWVAGGTYYPTTTTNRSLAFQLKPNVAIYGGFVGTEINLSQRNWTANPTILSGDIGIAGDASDNSSAVVSGQGFPVAMETNTMLDGVIVEKGGIGVSVAQASPTIRNCTIRSNSNSGFLFNTSTSLVENCSILWNRGNLGGGVSSFNGQPRIQNCVVSGNVSSNSGGGLFFQAGSPVVANSLISGNQAITGGGIGYASTPGSLQILQCTIAGNRASFTSGGGVYGAPVHCTMDDTILWGNSSAGSSLQKSQFDFTSSSSSNFYYNCIQGADMVTALSSFSVTNDPVFVAAKPAGEAPVAGGDYRLQPCSPLINSADPSVIPANSLDLDGFPRLVGRIDFGAYEYQSVPAAPLVITAQPQSQPYCAMGTVIGVSASGDGLSYQWQANFNDGNGFVPLIDDVVFSGTATPTLTITNANSAFHQSQYRCVLVSSNGCSLASDPATLTIQPGRLYVNAAAPAGGNGLSWATAYQKLEGALLSSNLDICGSEIWVAAGTYNPYFAPDGTYRMTNHVAIYGGFTGSETALYQRNWKSNLTIFAAQIPGQSVMKIFHNAPSGVPIDNSARLDGFVFRDAFYAIHNDIGFQTPGASPTIANCTFTNCSMPIQNDSSGAPSTPVIQDCLFVNNGPNASAPAGIGNNLADALIQRCEFRGNTGGAAAIISCSQSALKIYDCVISGNTANSAMVFIGSSSSADLRNCTIVGNKGNFSPVGLWFSSTAGGQVANCIIWANAGAGSPTLSAQINPGSASVYNSDIFGWTASGNGNVAINPLFAETIAATNAPTLSGDFRLAPCSPVLNAGNNLHVGDDLLDLENQPRVVGAAVDMGAYEAQLPPFALSVQPNDQFGSATNGVQFVAAANQDPAVVQWEINRGSGFVLLLDDENHFGATTPLLLVSNLSPTLNNYQYRGLIQTPAGCSLVSQTGTLHYVFGGALPTVSGNENVSVMEGSLAALATYTATSPDTNVFTWSTGGLDGARFQIDAGGNLSFLFPPDAGVPTDSNGDNTYNLLVIATDPFGNSGSLAVAVTVLLDPAKPYFVTTPLTSGAVGSPYLYAFDAVSPGGSNLVYSASTLPAWLTFVTNTYLVSTLAGGSPGTANGTGTNAQFVGPQGMALDPEGNLFLADRGTVANSSLRKITPAGVVTRAATIFPHDVVLDGNTNLYVTDPIRNLVVRFTPAGGSNNVFSTGTSPQTLAVAADGTTYYTRQGTHGIYKFVPGVGAAIFAGNETTLGFNNATGTDARFWNPRGLALAADGTLFVADSENHRIRKITPDGNVTTFAGSSPGYLDGNGAQARFLLPWDCALDAEGNVYVAEATRRIRKITPQGFVTTIAGTGNLGFNNGPAGTATFGSLFGIAVNSDGSEIYVADSDNRAVRKLVRGNFVYGTPQSADRGNHNVVLQVSDGTRTAFQPFTITIPDFTLQLLWEAPDLVVQFIGTPGGSYRIQFKSELANPDWTDLGSFTEGPPGIFSYRDASPAGPERYYRMISP